MKKMSKMLALMLVLVMVLALFAGCAEEQKPTETPATTGANNDTKAPDTTEAPAPSTTEEPKPAEYVPTAAQMVVGKEYAEDGSGDYQSLYSKFGKEASIADVEEDPETGLAYFNAPDGNQYELGLDFLTMAMVYNTSTEGTSFATEDEVYAEWWKYYITRCSPKSPCTPTSTTTSTTPPSRALTSIPPTPTGAPPAL